MEPRIGKLLKPLLLVMIVLAVPIVIAVCQGEMFADWATQWRDEPPAKSVLALAVIGILAADIFLPVPSGPLNALAGAQLGIPLATVVCWTGMTLGAVVAFGLAKRWGRPWTARFVDQQDLDSLRTASAGSEGWMLLITRPAPVLAEAAVLLAGLIAIPWRRFLPPVAAANLLIAATYAVLGSYAAENDVLALAIIASVLLPLVLALILRRRLAGRKMPAS